MPSDKKDGMGMEGTGDQKDEAAPAAMDRELTGEFKRPAERASPDQAPEGWLQAYQELQQQISHAHATYQQLMAESHLAFLHAAETTAVGLQSLVTGQPGQVLPSPPEGMPLPSPAAPPTLPMAPAFPAPPVYQAPAPAIPGALPAQPGPPAAHHMAPSPSVAPAAPA